MTRVILLPGLFILGCSLSSCREHPIEPFPEKIVAEIVKVDIADNPHNVLSAVVSLKTLNAVSVAVEVFRDSLLVSTSPYSPVTSDSASIAVLGLEAESSYKMRPIALSSTGLHIGGEMVAYETKPLPPDIPAFRVNHSDAPSVEFVLMGLNPSKAGKSYAVIVDIRGKIVWYRQLPGAVFDFQKQPPGVYTVSVSSGTGVVFSKLDLFGNIIETITASGTTETGLHELRMVRSDYALFGIEYRTLDLSEWGGPGNARVRGLVVESRTGGGPVRYWNTFDHFSVGGASSDVSLSAPTVNPWHGNAIDIDDDGSLLVSFRNSDEVTKINPLTGAILWRLGGKQNQFRISGDSWNGFSHQHCARLLPNGNILVFDNGNLRTPPSSRAVEYRIDEEGETAELVWEYRPEPPIFAQLQGSVQRLANGNTLINFGTAQKVLEVDQMGIKRWELGIGEPGVTPYRAFSVSTLY